MHAGRAYMFLGLAPLALGIDFASLPISITAVVLEILNFWWPVLLPCILGAVFHDYNSAHISVLDPEGPDSFWS